MIRPYQPGDMWQVLPFIRQSELDEAFALGEDPRESIEQAVYDGETITVVINGEICGLAGMIDVGSHHVPWSVFTDTVTRFPVTFLRNCRQWISRYDVPMMNVVLDRNEQTKTWLKWLGFKLEPPIEINGEVFRTYWGGTWSAK